MSKQTDPTQPIDKLIGQEQFIWAIGKSKLSHRLVFFLKKKQKLLISHGLKAGNIRSMTQREIFDKFVLNSSAGKIIEEFFRSETAQDIDKYLNEQKHTTEDMFEQMVLARMESLGLLRDLEEHSEQGARFYIACCLSDNKERMQLARKLEATFKSPQKKRGNQSLLMHHIVHDPNYLTVDKENGNNFFLLLLACMVSARFGEFQLAEQFKKKILDSDHAGEDGQERIQGPLERYLESSKPQGTIPAERLRLAQREEFENVNIEDLEVLSVCRRHISKEWSQAERESSFSEVLAVKRAQSSTWKELDKETAAKLFPTRGHIAHFTGRLKPTPPKYRQFCVWKVKPLAKVQSSVLEDAHEKIEAVAKIMPAYQIRTLDIRSTETERLVNEIGYICQNLENEDDHAVIRLADALYTKPQDGMRSLVDGEFVDPLQVWRQMSAIQLESGLNLHIGGLPDTSLVLDLSRSRTIIEKSLRFLLLLDSKERKLFTTAVTDLASNPKLFELIEEMQIDNLMWEHEEFARLARQMREMPLFASALDASLNGREEIANSKSRINSEIDEYNSKISKLRRTTRKNYEELLQKAEQVEKLVTVKAFESLEGKMTYLMLKDHDNLVKGWKLGKAYKDYVKTHKKAVKMLAEKMGEAGV